MTAAHEQNPAHWLGQCLRSRYSIKSQLGSGGMGTVYRALDLQSGVIVALKMLKSASTNFQDRFRREARLSSRLVHPHIVGLLDYIPADASFDVPLLVMEYVEGSSLEDLLDLSLPLPQVCELQRQILSALVYVHARDIFHRDIKPDNVLICRDNQGHLKAKVADFGLATARLKDQQETRLTAEGTVMGTPDYMAPEQSLHPIVLQPGIDLYPVGLMLYRMFFHELPFHGSALQIMTQKLHSNIPVPTEHTRLPEGLWEVIQTLLAREPEARYRTASDAIKALSPYCESQPFSDEQWQPLLTSLAGTASTNEGMLDTLHLPTAAAPLASEQLWGRQGELERLMQAAEEVEAGEGHIVLIEGEAGLGKTALVSTLALRLKESGRFFHLHTSYQPSAGAEVGLRRLLERFFGIVGQSTEIVRKSIHVHLQHHGVDDPQEEQNLINFLRPKLGSVPHSPEEHRQLSFALVVRILRMLAKHQPVLLTLDDVFRGGNDAAAFLEHLMFECSYEPFGILVLGTIRTGGNAKFEKTIARLHTHQKLLKRLTLVPLQPEELALGIAAQKGLPLALARSIAKRAGGNPLFAQMLLSDTEDTMSLVGLVVPTSPISNINIGGDQSLPPSLQTLIEQHLRESLAPSGDEERLWIFLQHMAVLGECVSTELLQEFTASLDGDIDDHLDALIRLGILEEDEQALLVSFHHGLFSEMLQQSLSKRKARRYHQKAALLRAAQAPSGPSPEAGAIAMHFVTANQPDDALQWWLWGFTYELQVGDSNTALLYGRSALDALPQTHPERPTLELKMALLLRVLGAVQEAIGALRVLVDQGLPDNALLAGEHLLELYNAEDRVEEERKLLKTMEERVSQAGELGKRAFQRATIYWQNLHGNIDDLEAPFDVIDQAPSGEEAHRLAIRLSWRAAYLRRPAEGMAFARRALAEAQDNISLQAEAHRMMGFGLNVLGHFDKGFEHGLKSLQRQRHCGNIERVVRSSVDLLYWAALAGHREPPFCLDELQESISLLQLKSDAVRFELKCLFFEAGRVPCLALAERVHNYLPRLPEMGYRILLPSLYLCLATVAAQDERLDDAIELFQLAGDFGKCPLPRHAQEALLARLIPYLRSPDATEAQREIVRQQLHLLHEHWAVAPHANQQVLILDALAQIPTPEASQESSKK